MRIARHAKPVRHGGLRTARPPVPVRHASQGGRHARLRLASLSNPDLVKKRSVIQPSPERGKPHKVRRVRPHSQQPIGDPVAALMRDPTLRRAEPRLSQEQRAEFAELVETGPDRAVHCVVRWRRIDLQRVIRERFGIAYHERTIGKLLKGLGFSHISARPRHPAQDARTIEGFKTYGPPRLQEAHAL
jgi:transposase